MTATSALVAALVLAPTMSGCSVSIVDPTESSTPASTTPERSEPSAQPGSAPPSSEPTSDSTLSAEGQVERARLIDAATTTMPCPSGPLTEDGAIIRVEGPCDQLIIEMDAGVVIADDVGALTLSGSGTVVYVGEVAAITVTGSASSIFWDGATPTVQDAGSANTLRRG
ncbi:hypothetical protein ASF63_18595 [Microbacterium sp. Leaf320]|nr:hypothetical protein ASF63_18595 [Microbacterium sp. Leaf320]